MNKLKKNLSLLLLLVIGAMANAQNSKIESVAMWLGDPSVDRTSAEWYVLLDKSMANMEEASKFAKTANSPKMYYYYGWTYLTVYLDGSEEQKKANADALSKASGAFFKCIETDEKKKYAKDAESRLLDCAIGHFNNGVNYYQANAYDEAIKSYERAAKILPLDVEGELKRRNITAETLYQYSYYSAMAKEDNKATKMYINKLIDMGYSDPKIYMDMVRVHLNEKDTTGALKYLEMGKDLDPNNVAIINTELDIYLKLGRSDELIKKLNSAIENDPENRVYYFARAVSFEKLNNTDGAEADYKKAIEIDETYADAYYNLGVIYINKCKPIADKIDKTYNDAEITKLENQIDEYYKKAADQFENALELGDYDEASAKDLMSTMKQIYARLMQNNAGYKVKYEDMKNRIAG